MSPVHISFSLVLLFTIVLGMFRVLIGPTAVDRMLAAQLFGTCGVAILLLLAKGMQAPVLLDIALVFALFAALTAITFVRRTWRPDNNEDSTDGNNV
jgi:multicomponent Na+:H+ antiporter subunit F